MVRIWNAVLGLMLSFYWHPVYFYGIWQAGSHERVLTFAGAGGKSLAWLEEEEQCLLKKIKRLEIEV